MFVEVKALLGPVYMEGGCPGFSVHRAVVLQFANGNYEETQLALQCLSMFSRLISPRLTGIARHQPFTW